MKKVVFTAFMLAMVSLNISCSSDDSSPVPPPPINNPINNPETDSPSNGLKVKEGFAGIFEAEGRTADTKFVRVLYAAEGSEKEGESDSMENIIFDSKDKDGKDIKAYRFQILCKNTGYDELQKGEENGDFKLKKTTEGVKLFVEVPITNGKMDLNNAVIGNFGYTFKGNKKEDKVELENNDIEQIKFTLKKLDIPAETAKGKPGDNGIFYELGHIALEFEVKTKTDNIKGVIDSQISIIHVRGNERKERAVTIHPEIVKKNVK